MSGLDYFNESLNDSRDDYDKKTNDEVNFDLMRLMQSGFEGEDTPFQIDKDDSLLKEEEKEEEKLRKSNSIEFGSVEIGDNLDDSIPFEEERLKMDNSVNEENLEDSVILEKEEEKRPEKPKQIVNEATKFDEEPVFEVDPNLIKSKEDLDTQFNQSKIDYEFEKEERKKMRERKQKFMEKMRKKRMAPKNFATYPVPKKNELSRFYIIRKKGAFKMFPKYYMYSEDFKDENGNDKFVLCAKKRKNNKTSNYCICWDQNDLRRESKSFVGKLRSNALGTRFYVYSKGANEETYNKVNPIRKQLGCISYETNILGSKGPRKMNVILPKLSEFDDNKYVSFPDKKEKKLYDIFSKKGDWSNINILKNKNPTFNEELQAYTLNFNGRVTKPSVKNFQLVYPQKTDEIQIMFGRIDDDKFTVDFRYPMSPLQAFSIALSSFDTKLVCD